MIALKPAFTSTLVLALLAGIASCEVKQSDPKEDLRRSLKGANVEGYRFSMKESDAWVTTSLTNSAVKGAIKLEEDASLPIQYTRVQDKKTKEEKIYRTDAVKQGAAVSLVITDLVTGEVVDRKPFPVPAVPEKGSGEAATGFDSLQQCEADFHCEHGGQLQCAANRTCQDQLAALTCCLKSGECYSVHLVVKPTEPRCQLKDLVPNLEGLVLTQG